MEAVVIVEQERLVLQQRCWDDSWIVKLVPGNTRHNVVIKGVFEKEEISLMCSTLV